MRSEPSRDRWRSLQRSPGHSLVAPFVELVIKEGLDELLYAHPSLSALIVSREHRWDATRPCVVVRPSVEGFHVQGVDPATGEEFEKRIESVSEAISVYGSLIRNLMKENPG